MADAVRKRVASAWTLCGSLLREIQFPQLTRYVCDLADLPAGDAEHERLRSVDLDIAQRSVVQSQEHARGGPGEPLVSIDQGMIHAQRMQQRGGLFPDIRVCLVPECDRGGAGYRRRQQTVVAHTWR